VKRFVNRQIEIAALNGRLARPASFVLVYGQRRTGKTWLLQHVLGQDPDCLFFTADETMPRILLDRFVSHAVTAGRMPGPLGPGGLTDWGTALTLLLQKAVVDGRRLVLVIDECQYLLDREPSLPSVLQRLWDEFHPRLPLHLLLCGSALSTLARLGDRSQPLHGRFDLRLHLKPFSYLDAGQFAASWSPVERLRAYGIFGGLARHLAYITEEKGLADNVCDVILDPLAPLHDAPHDILRAERLSAPAEADAVLSAMALGENRFNAIASRTGLTAPRLDYVLRELLSLDIVRRQARMGDAEGSKYVRYRCNDPFLEFWFRFVESNRVALQSTPSLKVYQERIAPHLGGHMGWVFEDVVAQAIARGLLNRHLGPVDDLGSWWSRDGKTQIDLAARSGERMAFVECKWRADATTPVSALHQLRDHVARSPFKTQEALLCIASAGGFSSGLRRAAGAGEVVLLGLDDLSGGLAGGFRGADSQVGAAP
jgi:AAA+ ATPase superfamily predicted ATPase